MIPSITFSQVYTDLFVLSVLLRAIMILFMSEVGWCVSMFDLNLCCPSSSSSKVEFQQNTSDVTEYVRCDIQSNIFGLYFWKMRWRRVH